MNIRKLLDWRKLLIYSHRWLGIGIIVMFLAWTLSGVVLMYYGHPQITTGERLLRLEPINLSTATVTPAEAAAKAGIKPSRVRLSMYDGRPVYRLSRSSIGNWSAVYADTGEVLPGMGREQALTWMKQFAPEHVSTMTYDAYLESPDEFTRIPTLAGYVPLHRIAMNDPAGAEYYVIRKEQRHRSENGPEGPHSSHFRLRSSQPVLFSTAHLVDAVSGFHRLDRHAHGL